MSEIDKKNVYVEDANLVPDDPQNFKGNHFNDDHEVKFFEFGAHFQISDLRMRLESIIKSQIPERLENIVKKTEALKDIYKEKLNSLKNEVVSLDRTKDNTRKQASGSKATICSDKMKSPFNFKGDSRNSQYSGNSLINSIIKSNRIHNVSKSKQLEKSFPKNDISKSILKRSMIENSAEGRFEVSSANKSNFRKIPVQSNISKNNLFLQRIRQTNLNYNIKINEELHKSRKNVENTKTKPNHHSKKSDVNSFYLKSSFNVDYQNKHSPFRLKENNLNKKKEQMNLLSDDLSKNICSNLSMIVGNNENKSRNVNRNDKFTGNKSSIKENVNKLYSADCVNVSNLSNMKNSLIKNSEKTKKIRNIKNVSYLQKVQIYKTNIKPELKVKKHLFSNEIQLQKTLKKENSNENRFSIKNRGDNTKINGKSRKGCESMTNKNENLSKKDSATKQISNNCFLNNQKQERLAVKKFFNDGNFLKPPQGSINSNQKSFIRVVNNNK